MGSILADLRGIVKGKKEFTSGMRGCAEKGDDSDGYMIWRRGCIWELGDHKIGLF